MAQYRLGIFYLQNAKYGKDFMQNAKKGIHLLQLSSINKCREAHYSLGYLYHEGKYITRDITKSIKYYKEASSFNIQYAKNNLGIIYKNGFGKEIAPNIGKAISYFEEAIQQKEDVLSMMNLSNIYIFEDTNDQRIDMSIKWLCKLGKQGMEPAKELLCIALIKKYGTKIEHIKQFLDTQTVNPDDFSNSITKMILNLGLLNKSNYKQKYQICEKIDFLYDVFLKVKLLEDINECKIKEVKNPKIKDASSVFYEGFGF